MKFGIKTIHLYSKVYVKEAIEYVAKRKKMSISGFMMHLFDRFLAEETKKDRHLKERSAIIQYYKHKEIEEKNAKESNKRV